MWLAEGIMVLHDVEDWPTGGKGRTPLLGPERWVVHPDSRHHAIDAKGGFEKMKWEESQYDFVSAIDKINAMLATLLNMYNGRTE